MPVAVLTAFLFALTGLCATQASRLLGGSRANAWRLLVALLILTVFSLWRGFNWPDGSFFWFGLAGAIGFGLGGWCMFQALPRIGSTLSLLVVECAAAVFAAVIGWIWLGAALSSLQILLMAMILAGILVGVRPGPLPDVPRPILFFGVGMATIAALFQSISFNISRHAFTLLREEGWTIDPMTAAYQRLIGGAVVAVMLWLLAILLGFGKSGPSATPSYRSPLPAPAWVGLNALFGPVLGVSAMLWAISLVPNPGLVQAVAATATLLTIPLARPLEGARPRLNYFVGCALSLAGVAGLLLVT